MKKLLMQGVIGLLILLAVTMKAAPEQDLVHPFDAVPYRDHKWYSGYLPITNGRFHYVFLESQRDPDNDPILLWFNGGPGCSSMFGLLYENGPFVFQHRAKQLTINQYAWNKNANLLYLQSPGGVGYSESKTLIHSDASVAQDNLEAILSFFKKFPNMKKNDFYMSGESYAGVYVPWLSWKILLHNDLPSTRDDHIKLKGFMIGNVCTDEIQCTTEANAPYFYQFLYNRGFFTEADYNSYKGACAFSLTSDTCFAAMERLDEFFENLNVNYYNIYATCYSLLAQHDQQLNYEPLSRNRTKILQCGKKVKVSELIDCDDDEQIIKFFNSKGHFQRFHVQDIQFNQCNDYVYDNFIKFPNGSIWIYPYLLKKNLRIWIYSGDVDAAVPITGTITWLQRLREEHGLPVIQPWRQWWTKGLHANDDQVAGMTWELKGLTFASVKAAGHQAPRDKRLQTYVMVNSFLKGQSLPRSPRQT